MKFSDIFSPATLTLLVALAIVTAIGFMLVPAGTILPIHWGISGEADGFLPRDAALLLPLALSGGLLALFVLIGRFTPPDRLEPGRHLMRATVPAMLVLFLTIAVGTVLIGTGVVVDMVRIVVFALGVLLLIVGNMLPKTRPNFYAGIRMPSVLNDPAKWHVLHRAAGVTCFVCGAALMVLAAITGHTMVLLAGVLIACLLPLLVGLIAVRVGRSA